MEAFRIRIIHVNGEISLRDYAFSQVCAMIKPMNDKEGFWNKEEIKLPNGDSILFVKEV